VRAPARGAGLCCGSALYGIVPLAAQPPGVIDAKWDGVPGSALSRRFCVGNAPRVCYPDHRLTARLNPE
jgi:hypothetical protein